MNMKEYILNDIKVLTPESSAERVQENCKSLPITHIPIVENGKLLGCISESDSQIIEDDTSVISRYSHLIDLFFANENTTILKLIKLFADNESNIMPVLKTRRPLSDISIR